VTSLHVSQSQDQFILALTWTMSSRTIGEPASSYPQEPCGAACRSWHHPEAAQTPDGLHCGL